MSNAKKLSFFLPNSFTALNMACGHGAIILSLGGRFEMACFVLVLGAIFDSVDGRIARLTGTQSSFGEQFDSISDVVSFGIAPAFLMYKLYLEQLGRFGFFVSFLYLLCGALRLARFNANINKVSSEFFQGLPIPGAALAIIGFVFLSLEQKFLLDLPLLAAGYTLFYAILMITNVPFCSFKKSSWIREHRKKTLLVLFVIVGLTFSYYKYMLALVLFSYAIISVLYYIKNRKKFGEAFDWADDN